MVAQNIPGDLEQPRAQVGLVRCGLATAPSGQKPLRDEILGLILGDMAEEVRKQLRRHSP
jgi:hypothetical protein